MARSDQRAKAIGRGIPPSGARRVPDRRLGQILVDQGDLSPSDQLRILAIQNRVEARYGDILVARGLIDRDRLIDALAQQFRAPVARFDRTPPDIRLIDDYSVTDCLAHGILPWRRAQGMTVVATARPEQFEDRRAKLESMFGPVQMAITGELDLHTAVLSHHPRALAARAEARVPDRESCRNWNGSALPELSLAVLVAVLIGLVAMPMVILVGMFVWVMGWLALNTALKFAVLVGHIRARNTPNDPEAPNAPVVARLPAVSILVPLYHEREIAQHLIKRLDRLDYPRELLDICLVVEADDTITCETIDQVDLPGHIRQIVVPESKLKTKPRALNYALDFCRGSIVGVYDAEDAPAPDQIKRVVQRFHERGPDVACLQGVLDFYNARTNWLSRCFTAEYAMWFRVMLPGLARLGLAIPLGGTTLFFRRKILDELGGWDAHNVTEDADLGIRLARHGYRTEMIDTVTQEEANARVWPWIKQRSRWLKGYAITWAVHMRDPRLLLRELGAWRFFGVQLLFLGTMTQFLLAPLLWSFWILPFGLSHPIANVMSAGAMQAVIAIFITSIILDLAIGAFALQRKGHRTLIPWLPTLYFYFPMAVLAAYKGVLELATRPFYWDKTAHGIFAPVEASEPDKTELAPPKPGAPEPETAQDYPMMTAAE